MNIIKGKGQRLIPEELLKYLQNQKDNGMNLTQLVDSNGNPRFIEGNGTPVTITGFTATYCKWSLSGTHLMVVLAGTVENESVITQNSVLVSYTLPEYILNKIFSVWLNNIEAKRIAMWAENYTQQESTFNLIKTDTGLQIKMTSGTITLTAKRFFRLQFDLLIDSE